MNHVISPLEFALCGSESDDRQLWHIRLDDADHMFRIEVLYSAMQDQGVDLGKHLKQVHRLLLGVGRNHIEFKRLQQQLARGESLFGFGFSNNKCRSWQRLSS